MFEEFEDSKLIAIKKLIKKANIRYYNEVINFIDSFLNGDFNSYPYLTNKIVFDVLNENYNLNIDLNKASKILSILNNLQIVKKMGKNKYFLIEIDEFKNIAYSWVIKNIERDINNLNTIFKNRNKLAIFECLNIKDGLKLHNKIFNSLDLSINIYQENNIPEFLFNKKWTELAKYQQIGLSNYLSEFYYKSYNTIYTNLKLRLEKLIEFKGKTGKIFRIIYPNLLNYLFMKNLNTKLTPKRKAKELLIKHINSFKNELIKLKPYFQENILFLIIELDNETFSNPISLMGPNFFQASYKTLIDLSKASLIYFYSEELSRIYRENYIKFFKYLLKNKLIEMKLWDPMISLNSNNPELGNLVFEVALKSIDKWISVVKQY
ncbi:MAG: hypothetical protein ACTSRP_03985 [Candidatus Helarchaeota archaeon]